MTTDSHPWQPSALLDTLKTRSRLLQEIRHYFHSAGVMEVDTPACSAAASTDPAIESLVTCYTGPGAPSGRPLYLHTSPEFPMKRLLAAGVGPIYQICKVFRDGESGRHHNPEFTLLEWYRPGFDHHQLMREVETLLLSVLPGPCPVRYISYGELFERQLNLDPHLSTADQLRGVAIDHGIPGASSLELPRRDAWLDLLMSHCIEPAMGEGLLFVYEYPESQASLARIRPGTPPVAERFELYLDGTELANGFHELGDHQEQRRRFQADQRCRADERRTMPPMDDLLLQALEAGLPDCAGVALGIDRLMMCVTGSKHIDEVLAFPLCRA
ncbi:MAG: EF-P lysine aminoacylase GenX [Gammaproteobacteria bacterium]|nr:EF-P lysine aminoacylase GenX [Gammaproteobacteria bacterium]